MRRLFLALGALAVLAGCVKTPVPAEEAGEVVVDPPVIDVPEPPEPPPLRETLDVTVTPAEGTQSMAISGSYLFMVSSAARLTVVSLEDYSVVGAADLDYGSYTVPHGNTCCFGKDRFDPSDEFPLLYVSQWHGDHERGVLVYRVRLTTDGVEASRVQAIFPGTDLGAVTGAGSADWVVDTDAGELYMFAYLLKGNTAHKLEGNAMIIARFRLPALSEGAEVTLGLADWKESKILEMFLVSQDKTYYKGRFYVAAGSHAEPGSLYLRVLTVSDLRIVAKVDLSTYGGEPQGLSFTEEGRLMVSYYYMPKLYYYNYDAGTTTNPVYLPGRR